MQPLYIKLLYRLEKLKARLARSKMPETPAPLYICAIFKNEADFLAEWVEFHLARGVDHLFLIDNFSSDNFREVLLPYLKSGQVTLLQTKHRGMSTRLQALAYNRAVRHIQKHHNPRSWVTFIDIDEYLFSVSDLTIKQILQSFSAPPPTGAVLVHWLIFGTSGVKKLQASRPMRKQLCYRAPLDFKSHRQFKSIVYLPNFHGFVDGPHLPLLKGSARACHADGHLHIPGQARFCHHPLRINHYWFRSRDYFENRKVLHHKIFGNALNPKWVEWHIAKCNEVMDESILQIGS